MKTAKTKKPNTSNAGESSSTSAIKSELFDVAESLETAIWDLDSFIELIECDAQHATCVYLRVVLSRLRTVESGLDVALGRDSKLGQEGGVE